ncbi:MAG: chorismate mutase, partial [Acetatifactor sp.]|nr:chorismate mutase [Acetatifactor sp.]
MDLLELRDKLDVIDAQIVELYEKRMDICRQVAEYKIEVGKKVFDRQREAEKLAKVRSLTHNEFNSHGIEELFEQIMSMSRKLQYRILAEHGSIGKLPFIGVDRLETERARVVFQGAEGAYSQAAMTQYFGDEVNSLHVDTFREAMSAIDEGSADFAVLPI